MTRGDHPSGTDRIAEANRTVKAEHVINVQADEPLVSGDQIRLLAQLIAGPADMATLATRFTTASDFRNPNQVKVVCDTSGAALLAIGEVGPLQRLDSLDPGVRLATAEVSDLAPLHFVDAATEPVGLRAQVLVAAEAAGIAEATRDISVAYALARQQFGKPIGAHQAVKHRCADMAVAAVAASAQAFFAALALDRSSPDAAFQCASATFVATTAAMGNATRNISNHGGLGFTWEHDAHLYLKRAHLLEALLGGRAAHLCELLDAPGPLTV